MQAESCSCYATVMRTIAALLFVLLTACGSEEAAAPPGARRIEILVDEDGYEPDRIEVRAGEPVTLVFRRTSDRGCGEVLVIPTEGIRRDLPLGQAVEIPLTAGRAGEILQPLRQVHRVADDRVLEPLVAPQ